MEKYYDILGNEISINDMVMITKRSKGYAYHVVGKITHIDGDNIEFDTVTAKGEKELKGNVNIKLKYKVKTNNNTLVKVYLNTIV